MIFVSVIFLSSLLGRTATTDSNNNTCTNNGNRITIIKL